ncbi:DNA mismatch repair protein [Rhizoclosmatium globosum]|uniref:DNA mismatch repair protein MSH2 n=1 Tax=Rhizoclosmatium globosum TaxID=329046 RepID=A0A1Y2CXS2_9FUNG|nr:DNA mismatch repair protein [Rhizoclosmatium globosum]|eukprot:ORY51832.1 DNA mismatch repair protein [Rhizoclosmatium globosum]
MSDEKPKCPDVAIDKPAEQAFCSFFRRIEEKAADTVRLFERAGGDYYTAHGDDALFVAEFVFKTPSVIKYWGGDAKTNGIPYVSISKLNSISLMRDLLLVKQKRVEIWENDGKNSKTFSLGKWASPGNLGALEDLLFANNNQIMSSPVVLAVKPGVKNEQKIIGLAYTDAATMHVIGVSEFVDNDTFSNFESILIQLSVKECIIPDDDSSYEGRKLKAILDRCGIVVTSRKRSSFDTKDVEQDLNRLLAGEINVSALPEYEMSQAMGAVASLLKYLQLLNDDSNFGQYRLENYDLSQYMRLDAAAMKALNLMPTGTEGSNKTMSLFGLLNQTRTSQGARLLAQWLKQPLMNLTEIETRQNLVESFAQDTEFRQSIQDECLKKFPDLHRIGKKFIRGKANLQDVLRVYQVVIMLPALLETLNNHEGEYRWLLEEMYTEKLKEYSTGLQRFQEMVETTIDIAAAENHEYIIKADFDEQLQVTKVAKDRLEKQLVPEAERVADDLGVEYEKKLKLEQHSQYGWHLRLTKADAAKIRGKREYIELTTNKSGSLFTTSKLKRLSGDIDELRAKYDELQVNLVKEIIGITAGYFPVFERLNQLIAHMDVIISLAHIAVYAPEKFVRPKLYPKGESDLILKGSRHPCLEVQDGVSFISNNVEMSRESSKFQIITGPNMGGKSTYIRQIGVIVLLAQIGAFVPCTEATLPLFDAVLCRVGASDSQLKGVSTFMAEMLETASILKAATPNSLIIIDELGRGTSTYDGFGLAWAISEHIGEQIGSFCLFATHFHELTAISEKMCSVKNLHVKAKTDSKSITLLYKVEEGICDQSFGIHVAELAAFPEAVVRLAKRKADELEDFSAPHEMEKKLAKFSNEEIEAGNQLIQGFLDEYKGAMNSSGVAEGMEEWDLEAKKVLNGLKSKYEAAVEENGFLREIVANM